MAALALIATLKFADYVMFTSLNRGFNPVSDLPLVASLYDLIVGTVGRAAAIAAVGLFIIAVIGLVAVLWWSCRVWSRMPRPFIVARLAAVAAIATAGLAIADIGQKMGRPLYAELHRATEAQAEDERQDLGLPRAATLLQSPTIGGQCWLAHATFANGLWIDYQTAYGAALNSGRQTLYHLAATAGFHTAAVMPQITLDWPEAQFMGFDKILAAKDLGYEGLPFNWITMPDQFTFAAMDRLLSPTVPEGARSFTQMALGSSHAPWVPVPSLLDWDALGDGTVFNPVVTASDTPRVVWKDHDRVRDQYKLAVDYALQVVFAYAALHAADPPLMIVVGDHQAAGFIALDERPHVPMHIIGPAHLVDALADAQFDPGLIPDNVTEIRSMSDMRAHLLQSLSSETLAVAPP